MIDYGEQSDCFIGTTAAIILAASAIGGAAIEAHAAGQAADKQQAATNQALGVQQGVYNQTRADLSPYTALGQGAVGNLRQLAGIPGGAPVNNGANLPPGVQGGRVSPLAYVQPNATSVQLPQGNYGPTTQVPTNLTASANPNGSQSSYVLMQAPTGERQQVPADQVSFYQQRGAQVVS